MEILKKYLKPQAAQTHVTKEGCNVFIPGFLKTGLAKISTHSTTWQFKTIKLHPKAD